MIEIPTNNNHAMKQNKVEELTEQLVKSLQQHDNAWGAVDCAYYGRDVLTTVLQNFKDKGWYTYYLERFDGMWISLQVYNYCYQPRNSGYNRLYAF